jgi:hypothetical protein
VREREDENRTREAGHLDEIQGVVANTLKLLRNGAVGFIDWLDGWGLPCKLNANPTEGATRQRQFGEAVQHTVLASQAPEYSLRLNRPP